MLFLSILDLERKDQTFRSFHSRQSITKRKKEAMALPAKKRRRRKSLFLHPPPLSPILTLVGELQVHFLLPGREEERMAVAALKDRVDKGKRRKREAGFYWWVFSNDPTQKRRRTRTRGREMFGEQRSCFGKPNASWQEIGEKKRCKIQIFYFSKIYAFFIWGEKKRKQSERETREKREKASLLPLILKFLLIFFLLLSWSFRHLSRQITN